MAARLIVEAGIQSGRVFTLQEGQTIYIGRDHKNDYSIPSSMASRVHCKILFEGGHASVMDMDSKNGTVVNGEQITSRALRDGDVIEVARNRLRFKVEEERASEPRKEKSEPIFTPPKPVTSSTDTTVILDMPEARPTQSFSEEERALVGTALGEFKVLGTLYAGVRTRVYKGTQPSKNRIVAIGILPLAWAEDAEMVRWFVNGAQAAGGLRHEDTVPVLGGGKSGNIYYCATLFMEQRSADVIFRRPAEKGISLVKRALQAVIHAARALEFGLSRSVLHRGIRPTKLLFDDDYSPKLGGLGFDNGPGPGFAMTSAAAGYLAPEQKVDAEVVDHRTDIYGLGATFYAMLAGHLPHWSPRGELDSAKAHNRVVPDSLCRILEKMLDPEPARRYPSYGQLLHDLRWALRGEVWPRE